ncbi:hypothetical protein GGI13_006790, partial [Coemansia sp. RSA 455]
MSLSKDSLPPVGHAISGAGSSALALLLIYPLDTIKTRLQVQTRAEDDSSSNERRLKDPVDAVRKIVSSEGVSGLYAGLGSNLANQLVNGFVYFYAYSVVRKFALRVGSADGGKSLSTVVELAVGAVAGMINQLITLPIGVVATRQQTAHVSERRGWMERVSEIIQMEGVQGL